MADQLLTGVKSVSRAEALLGAGGREKVFPIVDNVASNRKRSTTIINTVIRQYLIFQKDMGHPEGRIG